MTKHFQHIPVNVPDMEAGIPTFEHCLNLIGENDNFWWQIDHLFETDTSIRDKKIIAAFKTDLLNYLANFIYENPPHVADKNARQLKIEALESISNAVKKLLKNYKYVKTDLFLHFSDEVSLQVQRQDNDSQDDDLARYAYKKERDFFVSLKVLQKIAEQSDVSEREDPAIMNAHLQECMAIYLAELLSNIGVKPTTSREGIFEVMFGVCCKVVGFREPKAGNRHVATALKHIKKNSKRS